MISKVHLSNLATFQSATMEPKTINFIYGGNGTGKTTLARFLVNPYFAPESSIENQSTNVPRVVVYNSEFVESNIRANPRIPGVFTLGKDSIETLVKIEELKKQQEDMEKRKEGYVSSRNELYESLKQLTEGSQEKCWEATSEYRKLFSEALVGKKTKKGFLDALLSFYQQILGNKYAMTPLEGVKLDDIKETYRVAYSKDAYYASEYPVIDLSSKSDLTRKSLFSKIITGSSNSPIGTFIEYLKSSDWVKQGLTLAYKSKGKCPFCQQEIPESLFKEIEQFFDEEYEKDCQFLQWYQEKYIEFLTHVKETIKTIEKSRYAFLQYDEFEMLNAQIKSVGEKNTLAIQTKIATPSKVVEIIPISDLIKSLNSIICAFNDKIRENNRIFSNREVAREKVKESVLDFLTRLLHVDLKKHIREESGLNKGIKNLSVQIEELDQKLTQVRVEIHEEEKNLTSIFPTISAINSTLENFGFTGFSLAANKEYPGTYSIIRHNGSDARQTLSEGECNFLAFLYYYHLCKGSLSNTGLNDNTLAVIDDPVSSLDSNAMFIISTLVKSLISICIDKKHGIRQVFVLTHNVYFYKEVTYNAIHKGCSNSSVAYFIIRKRDNVSSILQFKDNPIQTSYTQLWDVLRNPSEYSVNTIFNTMRRILEHYFKITGGIEYERYIKEFEDCDMIIGKALISLINDGSHTIFEDSLFPIDETMIEHYQKVFRMIFERTDQIEHYNMMMNRPKTK